MGKSKKIIWFLLFPLLLLVLLIFWRLELPRLKKAELEKLLGEQFGYTLQMEEFRLSAAGTRCVIKKGLLIDRQVIEHPILAADEIRLTRRFSKITLFHPKVTLTADNAAATARFMKLLRFLRQSGTRFDIRDGEMEIWAHRPFEGTPVELTGIHLNGSAAASVQAAVRFTLPSGLNGLRPFFTKAKLFTNKKISISTQAEFFDDGKGFFRELDIRSQEEPLLKAHALLWELRAPVHLLVFESPSFAVEHTHTGRWRISNFVLSSLISLWKEVARQQSLPPVELRIKDGSVVFSDKYVFPLFTALLQPVSFSLVEREGVWQADAGMKGQRGALHLEGIFSQEKPAAWQAHFRNLPAPLFFPYYYNQIPYDKLRGAFSGRCTRHHTLRLKLRGALGPPVPGQADPLGQLTGVATPLLLTLLQNEKGEIKMEFPFSLQWPEFLAVNLIAQLPTALKGWAEVDIQQGKIAAIEWKPFSFQPGSARISDDEQQKLRRMARWLAALPFARVSLQGGATSTLPPAPATISWVVKKDPKGFRYLAEEKRSSTAPTVIHTPEQLAQARALAVQAFLLKTPGVAPSQITLLAPAGGNEDKVSFQLSFSSSK